MQVKETQKKSLFKAILFCFLVLLGASILQFLAQYIFESFNKLLIVLTLLGTVGGLALYCKYYNKHYWIPAIMIIVFSLLFSALATFFSDVLIFMKGSGESFGTSFEQLYYALFDASKVSSVYDAAALSDAIHYDMRLGLIFAVIGIVVSGVYLIIVLVQSKKASANYAAASTTNTSTSNQQQTIQAEQTLNNDIEFKSLFNNMRQIVVGYKQDKNKDLFLEGVATIKQKYNSLDDNKKKDFKQYVKDNYSQSDDADDVVAAHLIESKIN